MAFKVAGRGLSDGHGTRILIETHRAVHYDGYMRDPGIPDMVQHADQGGGVLWDSVVRPTSEEVVVVGGVSVILHYMQQRSYTGTYAQRENVHIRTCTYMDERQQTHTHTHTR